MVAKTLQWLTASTLIAFLTAFEASGTITITITPHLCTTGGESCPAPQAIHFSARGTTCSTSECDDSPMAEEAFHSLHYSWDFGDSGSGTWNSNGRSKNTDIGPIAVHVYDTAGTKTVTLTVTSGSETDTLTEPERSSTRLAKFLTSRYAPR